MGYYVRSVGCRYKTAQATTFGQGSEQEMCIDYMGYYPRQAIVHQKCGLGYPGGKLVESSKKLGSLT